MGLKRFVRASGVHTNNIKPLLNIFNHLKFQNTEFQDFPLYFMKFPLYKCTRLEHSAITTVINISYLISLRYTHRPSGVPGNISFVHF